MKTTFLKARTAAVSLAIGMTCILATLEQAAAVGIGPRTLGAPTTAMDIYRVTCPAALTNRLAANVRDNDLFIFPFPAPIFNPSTGARVRIFRDSGAAPVSAATFDLSEGFPGSPTISLTKGPGVYHVMVDKSSNPTATEDYLATISCLSVGGLELTTTINSIQNQ